MSLTTKACLMFVLARYWNFEPPYNTLKKTVTCDVWNHVWYHVEKLTEHCGNEVLDEMIISTVWRMWHLAVGGEGQKTQLAPVCQYYGKWVLKWFRMFRIHINCYLHSFENTIGWIQGGTTTASVSWFTGCVFIQRWRPSNPEWELTRLKWWWEGARGATE